MSAIEKKINALAGEVGENLGYEVDDLEVLGSGRRTIVRVTIDREGGVGLDDCTAFSRDFEALMDVEDPIKERYTLEVSSPGLDRPLRKPRHWLKSMGKLARVVLLDPMGGRDVITGRIEAFSEEDGRVTLLMDDGTREELSLDEIKRARLEVQL
jgi:ribosome maturation factor RimP